MAGIKKINSIKAAFGFTLVEVLVTLAIAVILITISVPSFTSLYGSHRADNAIREIKQTLNDARSQAINYQHKIIICPTKNPDSSPIQCTNDWKDTIIVYKKANDIQDIDIVVKIMPSIPSNDVMKIGSKSIIFTASGRSEKNTIVYCPSDMNSPYSKNVTISTDDSNSEIIRDGTSTLNCNSNSS